MYTDLMIDLETLSTRSNAEILSIGYQFFNPEKELYSTEREIIVNVNKSLGLRDRIRDTFNPRYHVCPKTLEWWGQQGEEARRVLNSDDAVSVRSALEILIGDILTLSDYRFLRVWGNGSSFDISIIENAFITSLNCEAPWRHWNVRDVRTLVQVGKMLGIDPKKDTPFKGIKHNAAHDAAHQAKYCTAIYQHILKTKSQTN